MTQLEAVENIAKILRGTFDITIRVAIDEAVVLVMRTANNDVEFTYGDLMLLDTKVAAGFGE